MIVQDYQTLAMIATQALGGGGKKTSDKLEVPQTAAQMERAFDSVFGK